MQEIRLKEEFGKVLVRPSLAKELYRRIDVALNTSKEEASLSLDFEGVETIGKEYAAVLFQELLPDLLSGKYGARSLEIKEASEEVLETLKDSARDLGIDPAFVNTLGTESLATSPEEDRKTSPRDVGF